MTEYYIKVYVEDAIPEPDDYVFVVDNDSRKEGMYVKARSLIPVERVIVEVTEPRGFGAAVMDRDGNGWVRTQTGRWVCAGAPFSWDTLVKNFGPVTVLSKGLDL